MFSQYFSISRLPFWGHEDAYLQVLQVTRNLLGSHPPGSVEVFRHATQIALVDAPKRILLARSGTSTVCTRRLESPPSSVIKTMARRGGSLGRPVSAGTCVGRQRRLQLFKRPCARRSNRHGSVTAQLAELLRRASTGGSLSCGGVQARRQKREFTQWRRSHRPPLETAGSAATHIPEASSNLYATFSAHKLRR